MIVVSHATFTCSSEELFGDTAIAFHKLSARKVKMCPPNHTGMRRNEGKDPNPLFCLL